MSFMLRLDAVTVWVVVRTILLDLNLLHDFNLNNLTSVWSVFGNHEVIHLQRFVSEVLVSHM